MWNMGGYGIYVWPCYGLVFVGMIWLLVASIRRDRYFKRQFKENIQKHK